MDDTTPNTEIRVRPRSVFATARTNRRWSRISKYQIQIIIDFMAAHKYFANGEYLTAQGGSEAAKRWADLQNLVNRAGAPCSIEHIESTWTELKKVARLEKARAQSHLAATGGGPELPVSDRTNKILSIIGNAAAIGVGPAETPISRNVSS